MNDEQRAKEDEAFIQATLEKSYVDNVIKPRCNVGQEIEVGDVVQLKSGGPHVTVMGTGGDAALCVWMDNDGQLQVETISYVVLTLDVK